MGVLRDHLKVVMLSMSPRQAGRLFYGCLKRSLEGSNVVNVSGTGW